MLDLLYNRRSIRRYKKNIIEDEKIEKIIKAGLLSPSGKGLKPWKLVVVQNKETLEKLSTVKKAGSTLINGAPLAIVVLGDEQLSGTWVEDTSILCTIMQLEIEKLGLGSCWVQIRIREDANGRKSEDIVKNILEIPENMRVEAIIAVGYKDEKKSAYTETDIDMSKVSYEIYSDKTSKL